MVQLKKYLIMNIKTALAILVWITSVITTGILVQNTKTDNIIVEEIITICDKEKDSLTMEENIYLYLDSINLKFKTVVIAQAILESGNFKSKVFQEYNNIFGMKKASKRPSLGVKTGNYNKYKSWQESILDYAFYQAYFCSHIRTEEEYLDFLNKNYAEDNNYKEKLEKIIAKLRNTNSLTKS